MKIFLSYRYTGEDLEKLKVILGKITESFKKKNWEYFCSFYHHGHYEKNNFNYNQILDYCLENLDKSDYVLAFVKSQEKSEGMLLELGYATAKKKKIILLIQEDIHTSFLEGLSAQVLKYKNLDEIYEIIEKINL